MTFPGGSSSIPPRPEWRATLAAVSILLFILCLCVMVVGARGQGGGLAGALLRRFANIPVLGRLVEPLLRSTPTPVIPAIQLAPEVLPPTPTPATQYLVRPSNWPTDWPWPPQPLNPPPLPAVQPTAAPVVQPTPAPATTPTPSDEEQRQRLAPSDEGASG